MKVLTQTYLTDDQKETVLKIWNAEYPVRLQMSGLNDFDDFLNPLVDAMYYLLIDQSDNIVGWATTFLVEHIRSFFIMLDSGHHGKGFGTVLLNELKKENSQLFGWAIDHNNDLRIDGAPYPSPINFYRKNGFTVNNNLRLENDLLSAVNILWERG